MGGADIVAVGGRKSWEGHRKPPGLLYRLAGTGKVFVGIANTADIVEVDEGAKRLVVFWLGDPYLT